jgi:SAM-dependent methyltransferase
MQKFCRRKADQMGLTDCVYFAEGDAEALTFANHSFDSMVSLYAWRHLPDPTVATLEAFRVLRPGGTFVLAVGSGPPLLSIEGLRPATNGPQRWLARKRGLELTACDHLDALIEKHLPRSKQAEVADWTVGHHRFSGSLSDLLRGAGFRVIVSGWAGRTYAINTHQDYFQLQATFSPIARKRIAYAAPEQIEALKMEFREQFDAVQRRGGKALYRVGASIFSAIKP